jgi:meso-butanediol dehydrogenase / (S,S)-butanediol dehydrogenase / diacetyl reductase
VVGAGSGLGKAIARQLASRGEHVLLVGRTAKKLDATREGLPESKTHICTANICNESEAKDAFAHGLSIGYPIRSVFCCLGDPAFAPVGRIDEDNLRAGLDNNLVALIICSEQAINTFQHFDGRKQLLLVLSTGAQTARAQEPIYTAAKWGARGYFLALREHLRGSSVDVTAVYPGGMRTPFWERDAYLKPATETYMAPEEVADIILRSIPGPEGPLVDRR